MDDTKSKVIKLALVCLLCLGLVTGLVGGGHKVNDEDFLIARL